MDGERVCGNASRYTIYKERKGDSMRLSPNYFVRLSSLQLVANLTSPEYADMIRSRIDDNITHDIPYYDPTFDFTPDHGTTHLNVLGPDGSAVAITSTINFLYVCV